MPTVTRLTRVTLLAAAMLTVMAGTPIASSLPGLRAHFADVEGVDLLVRMMMTCLGISIALTGPLAGIAVDRIGRRPVMLAGVVVYVVAGCVGLVADSIGTMLIGRMVLGVGVGMTMIANSALIADLFRGDERQRYLGLQSAATQFGGVIFMVLGGVLAELHWRAAFGVYLLGVPVALLLLRLPERRVVSGDGGAGDDDPDAPQHLRWWPVIALYALTFVFMMSYYLMPTELPFRLSFMGISSSMTGVVLASSVLAGAGGALSYARWGSRLRSTAVVALVLVLFGCGWIVIGSAATVSMTVLGLMLAGYACGAMFPCVSRELSMLSPARMRGRVFSGFSSSLFAAQFLSPILLHPLSQRDHGAPAFVATGIGALLLAAACAWIARRPL